MFLHLFDRFYCKFMNKLGLKALGNYSASFKLIMFSVAYVRDRRLTFTWLLGFWDLWEPLFIDLNVPNHFNSLRKFEKCIYRNTMFWKMRFGKSKSLKMLERVRVNNILKKCGGSKTIGVNDRLEKQRGTYMVESR